MSKEQLEGRSKDKQEVKDVSMQVIAPNLPAEAAIKRVDSSVEPTSDEIRTVGYPKFLFEYQCSLSRAFLSDREASLSITVDGINCGRLRNDVYPELVTRTLPTDALLQPRLTCQDAAEHARSVLRKYFSFHYPTYMLTTGMPNTEILQEDMAYGLYWLVPTKVEKSEPHTVSVVDSISGEVIEDEVRLSRVIEPDTD